jgi:hypothetical protein
VWHKKFGKKSAVEKSWQKNRGRKIVVEKSALEKLLERSQRHVFRGSDYQKGRMSDMTSLLHQSDTICQKGEILFI